LDEKAEKVFTGILTGVIVGITVKLTIGAMSKIREKATQALI